VYKFKFCVNALVKMLTGHGCVSLISVSIL